MTKPKKKPQSAKVPGTGGTNIFLSWSGDTSRAVAQALFEWLKKLMDDARPWMSKESIRSGVDWFASLKQHLQDLEIAIVCVAPDNLDAHWLLFEAGAFAGKVSESARVITYHVGVEFHEVTGPLSKYQARQSTKDDTWQMVKDINEVIGGAVSEATLKERFEAFWDDFERKLKAAPKPKASPKKRNTDEMIVEVLETLRAVQRDLANRPMPLDYVTPGGTIIQGLVGPRTSITQGKASAAGVLNALFEEENRKLNISRIAKVWNEAGQEAARRYLAEQEEEDEQESNELDFHDPPMK